MKKVEILAPVGGEEQLTAAVRSGADAVYFGASSFNARRNAHNFTDDDFIGAVRFCRERGVKAYITLNTLIKDSERDEFLSTLALIARSGADAVILQDMGALSLVKQCCPDMPLHASTQMAVHNVSGAKALERLGFSRIVLARELSLREIKAICEAVSTEIEVFVHGAHCMSASGMCYMSSVLGARSGNRGLCAQPCRLNFKVNSREYALSLKDMCLADNVAELIDAGVTSLKIEGRMKRPEYVAAATVAYKNAANGVTADVSLLQSIFSRSGFTKGYFEGRRNLSMFGYRTKDDVVAAGNTLLSSVANTYRNENPLVKIKMKLTVRENEESTLELTDGVNTLCVKGAVPEKAEKVPLSAESAERSLSKVGSTFFSVSEISSEIDDGLMLRASDINSLRRDACEALVEKRAACEGYSFTPYKAPFFSRYVAGKPELYVKLTSFSQYYDEMPAKLVILPIGEILKNREAVKESRHAFCAELPALIYGASEEKIRQQLKEVSALGIKSAYCDNIGAVEIAKGEGFEIIGGTLLNVMNSSACEMYHSLGVNSLTLSSELSCKGIKNIKTHARTGFMVYGHLPLMHFRCCPLQSEKGCGECNGRGEITDRMGEKFPVMCKDRQYSVLYNTVPLYLGDKALPQTDFVLLSFTAEKKYDVKNIIFSYENKKALAGRKTAGLFEREVL